MTAFPTNYVARWQLSRDGASDSRELVVELPIKTISETNQREHWARRYKRRRAQRDTTGLVLRSLLMAEGVAAPCSVKLVRVAPRALDGDNLQGALKAIRDGIADALGVDDRAVGVHWTYDQTRGAVKQYAVRITIRRTVAA